MLKRYKIIQIIFAKNMKDAITRSDEAEVVDVELQEEVKNPNPTTHGFSK